MSLAFIIDHSVQDHSDRKVPGALRAIGEVPASFLPYIEAVIEEQCFFQRASPPPRTFGGMLPGFARRAVTRLLGPQASRNRYPTCRGVKILSSATKIPGENRIFHLTPRTREEIMAKTVEGWTKAMRPRSVEGGYNEVIGYGPFSGLNSMTLVHVPRDLIARQEYKDAYFAASREDPWERVKASRQNLVICTLLMNDEFGRLYDAEILFYSHDVLSREDLGYVIVNANLADMECCVSLGDRLSEISREISSIGPASDNGGGRREPGRKTGRTADIDPLSDVVNYTMSQGIQVLLPGARVEYNGSVYPRQAIRTWPQMKSPFSLREADGRGIYATDGSLGTVLSIGEQSFVDEMSIEASFEPGDFFEYDKDGKVRLLNPAYGTVVKMDKGGYVVSGLQGIWRLVKQGTSNEELQNAYRTFLRTHSD